MLSAEENNLLCQVGPGTPMGEVMRRYWQPVGLTEELPVERPAKAVKILNEDLVLFRDDQGRVGLVDRYCAHRAADLSYGRIEDGGLRCCYHGWLYDTTGQCLDQPAEPAGSLFYEKIRIKAYPCQEVNGIIYTYMGPGEPPLMPAFDWNIAPREHVSVFKGYQAASYLQANEGEIDPAHLGILHRVFSNDVPEDSYGNILNTTAQDTDIPLAEILRNQWRPLLEAEPTDFGVRITIVRDFDPLNALKHVRISHFLFPNAALVAIDKDRALVQWHVPIDDESNWRFDIAYSYTEPLDDEKLRNERLLSHTMPDYMPIRNKTNRYGYDPEEQRTQTYIGVGFDINTHDTWAIEGPGPIQDRTKEHLGTTDKAIIMARQMLLKAAYDIQEGTEPPAVVFDPDKNQFDDALAIDTTAPTETWREVWKTQHAKRRAASPWASKVEAPKFALLMK